MSKYVLSGFLAMLIVCAAKAQTATDPANVFQARLIGARETPVNSTPATGTFQMTIASDNSNFTYQLTFANLVAPVTQAHIHFGQFSVSGGIMIWLCQTPSTPGPAGPPPCPAGGGTVMGTVTAAQVVGPMAQGISPGQFAQALDAIRMGIAYANVHSTTFPAGEIRGQITY